MTWETARYRLEERLLTTPGIDTSKIVWPNEGHDHMETLHYRVHFIPIDNEPELHGANHEKGIFQITVQDVVDNGIGASISFAQVLVNHFQRQNLAGVFCGVPKLVNPNQEPDCWRVIVSIPFTVL